MTTPLPSEWEGSDVLDGLDILDKSQLVGVPFRTFGCAFKPNNEGVSICYIDAHRADGYAFTFLDSSTGVRAQVVKYLTEKGLDSVVESGEYADFQLVAPDGLRVSEYDVPIKSPNGQPIPGKTRQARTYYMTTNGKRGARGKATTPTTTQKRTPTAK
jgi:hypothetical protein